MDILLMPEEVRVIGCLMEKAVTTPEQYPLTLNALTNACNQKSSRYPVMSLPSGLVQRTARQLEEKHLITRRDGQRQHVERYSQRLCNTPMARWHFTDAEYAIVSVLLLRGAQTPGELRTRTARMFPFADNRAVVDALKGLMDRDEGAVVARLPRRPGRQDHEYIHLLSGDIASAPEDEGIAPRKAQPHREDSVAALEARIDALERALRQLAERLGEELDF